MYFDHVSESRHLGTADRDQVVHVVRAVLGHAQPARESGKKKFISAGASVSGVSWKIDPDAVDDELLTGVRDLLGRRDQARPARAGSPCRARSRRVPRRPQAAAGRTGTALAGPSPDPAITFSDDRLPEEVLGAMIRHRPASTSSCVGDAEHATEVIGVAWV